MADGEGRLEPVDRLENSSGSFSRTWHTISSDMRL
jgi:hypothetical protein